MAQLNPTVQRIGVSHAPRMGRKIRRPAHSFNLVTRPYQIQPFLLAPVLPGETLKNLLLQSRVVSDPIKNPLIGWWNEYYFFYVKHRDMTVRAVLQNMMLDPATDVSTVKLPVQEHYYHQPGTMGWSYFCLQRVVQEYFRGDGEGFETWLIGNLPAASINNQSWLDSLIASSQFTLADVDVDSADANTTIQASEIDRAMRTYELLLENKLTTQTYEEYLATYGIAIKPEETNRPELIRYVRDWTYPTNTVEPTTGTPSSAVSWSHAERADKDRFFREPGFVFGVTVCRPKVYLNKQVSSVADYMDNVYSWLPAILNDDWRSSFKEFLDVAPGVAGSGPLGANAEGAYWIDLKDLFLYGDQYLNYSTALTDKNLVGLPVSTTNKRYPTAADVDALFAAAPPKNTIRQDGVVTLQIASALGADTSSTT